MMQLATGQRLGVAPSRSMAVCRPASRPRMGRSFARASLIGDINDPEKTKENKKKKENDSVWSEPKSAKGGLEKKPIAHGAGSAEASDAVKEVGDKAKEAVDNVKDAIKGATDK